LGWNPTHAISTAHTATHDAAHTFTQLLRDSPIIRWPITDLRKQLFKSSHILNIPHRSCGGICAPTALLLHERTVHKLLVRSDRLKQQFQIS